MALVLALMLVGATAVMGASPTDPTTTWNVTPVELTFPDGRSCPAGSTLFRDQFQSVTENPDGTYSASILIDGTNVTVEVTTKANNSFDFEVTNGVIPQMFVKGSNYLLYRYDPPVAGATNTGAVSYDTGLHDGVNDQGAYQDVSHLDFCVIPVVYEPLTAEKTAAGAYDRTVTWTLEKSVKPGTHTGILSEDAGISTWTVVADKSVSLGNYRVEGTITVFNTNDIPVAFSISDSLDDGTAATVTCPVTGNNTGTVPANDSIACDYAASPADDSATLNTANVTSQTDGVDGAQATANVGWTENLIGYDSGTLSDPRFGYSEVISGDTTETFLESFTCPRDGSLYDENGEFSYSVTNTAKLNGNINLSDSASVNVTCYAPVVTKNASATYDEIHRWTVQKSVDPASQSGYPGDTLPWEWEVTVSETSTDVNFAVTGKIFVDNPADESMTVSVGDVLGDGTIATVDCDPVAAGNQISLTIPAGQTGTCDYSAAPGDASATTNTATATLNGVDFTHTVNVNFVKNVIGGTATVVDDQIGLDENLAAGGGPWEFTAPDSHTCSTSGADYGADGMYSATLDNTATLTDSEGNELSDDATTTYTCEAAFVDLKKLTNGAVDPSMSWTFKLFKGPDGFGSTQVGATSSTAGDADGVLTFGYPALRPDTTYTVCELGIPAGYSSLWKVDGNIVNPYNPDANNNPSEDLGNRCVDFGDGTLIPLTVKTTLHFEVDNTQPGGDPRTPGYWKNWNRCTIGGQAANADRNGGYAEGFWLLEDVLNPAVGGGIVWDDILADTKLVPIDSCEEAVEILDQRVVNVNGTVGDGKKIANDAARTLAMHLLAAQLNFGAGACTTGEVLAKALEAETLLDKLNFDGTKSTAYLTSKSADYNKAISLAGYLDKYNNGAFCGSLNP